MNTKGLTHAQLTAVPWLKKLAAMRELIAAANGVAGYWPECNVHQTANALHMIHAINKYDALCEAHDELVRACKPFAASQLSTPKYKHLRAALAKSEKLLP